MICFFNKNNPFADIFTKQHLETIDMSGFDAISFFV